MCTRTPFAAPVAPPSAGSAGPIDSAVAGLCAVMVVVCVCVFVYVAPFKRPLCAHRMLTQTGMWHKVGRHRVHSCQTALCRQIDELIKVGYYL